MCNWSGSYRSLKLNIFDYVTFRLNTESVDLKQKLNMHNAVVMLAKRKWIIWKKHLLYIKRLSQGWTVCFFAMVSAQRHITVKKCWVSAFPHWYYIYSANLLPPVKASRISFVPNSSLLFICFFLSFPPPGKSNVKWTNKP